MCSDCPFRKDIPKYLRQCDINILNEWTEINHVQTCHQTVYQRYIDPSAEWYDYQDPSNYRLCVGHLKHMNKHDDVYSNLQEAKRD